MVCRFQRMHLQPAMVIGAGIRPESRNRHTVRAPTPSISATMSTSINPTAASTATIAAIPPPPTFVFI
jgi:hypothetical protein